MENKQINDAAIDTDTDADIERRYIDGLNNMPIYQECTVENIEECLANAIKPGKRNEFKKSEVVYVQRVVKFLIENESNWHGPMSYGAAIKSGLTSTSSGTVAVTIYSEDEYADLVASNPHRTFA